MFSNEFFPFEPLISTFGNNVYKSLFLSSNFVPHFPWLSFEKNCVNNLHQSKAQTFKSLICINPWVRVNFSSFSRGEINSIFFGILFLLSEPQSHSGRQSKRIILEFFRLFSAKSKAGTQTNWSPDKFWLRKGFWHNFLPQYKLLSLASCKFSPNTTFFDSCWDSRGIFWATRLSQQLLKLFTKAFGIFGVEIQTNINWIVGERCRAAHEEGWLCLKSSKFHENFRSA